MELTTFNSFCGSKPGTQKVIQWGGAHVWKVGGKIFAIASHWGKDTPQEIFKISFKASEFSFQILTEQPNIIPAPYLGRYRWVQLEKPDALDDKEVCAYVDQAYGLVLEKLPKATQKMISGIPT